MGVQIDIPPESSPTREECAPASRKKTRHFSTRETSERQPLGNDSKAMAPWGLRSLAARRCPSPPRFERVAGPNPCTLHAVEQIVNVRGWQRKIPKRPVLQVVSVEAINCARSSFEVARNPQGRTDRYQCGLSDSIRYHAQFTIHPRLNHLIHDGKLQVGSVIALDEFNMHEEGSNCVICTISALTILSERDPLYGSPRSWFGSPIPKSSSKLLLA